MTHDFAFSGLIACAKCGCSVVGEIKKQRYIYYHCTGYVDKCQGNPPSCRRSYVREELLEKQFTELLGRLKFDDKVLEWVRDALHASHADERRDHEEAIKRHQAEYKRLQDRIDAMYVDKLDSVVDTLFFEKMSNQWREEQNRCHGFGGGRRGSRIFSAVAVEPVAAGWSRARGDGTVASYVNPNAKCPVCRAPVIFYRSPYDGRVFFDPPLGPPWPKHPCTDRQQWHTPGWGARNGSLPHRVSPTSNVALTPRGGQPSQVKEGYEPFCSANLCVSEGRMLLTGDVRDKFTELLLFDVPTFDRNGPVLTRPHEGTPGFHVIAVLLSDYAGTRERYYLAFEPRLVPLGVELLARAVDDNNPAALAEIGRFMLYELEDLPGALVYLEEAHAAGVLDVTVDLAIAALFRRSSPLQ